MPEVRPFARHDRDALTALANRHIAAVLPGGAVPVATLLSQLERDTREPIVDPWVTDRHTLVGIDAEQMVAAAYLKRYDSDERVGIGYRNQGEIAWLLCDPANLEVGRETLAAAMSHLSGWQCTRWLADGNLPCLGVYGIPDSWPHIERLLVEAGFDDDGGQVEIVYAGDISQISEADSPPLGALELRRVVGPLGTSFEAWIDTTRIGVFEVEDAHGTSNAQLARWADEANHWVAPEYRGHGVGPWLFRQAASWLRLAGKDRLLAYAVERRARGMAPMDATTEGCDRYYRRLGLQRITRTRRGWHREPW
jgi:GNAT superfamily N-acetyltransferase